MRVFVFLIFLCSAILQAQEHAWVYFKDKPNAQTYLDNPNTMLTQRALDRRSSQDIAVTIQDVPVDETYILSVENSNGITVKARSRWLNTVHVIGSEIDIANLQNLTFVDSIQFAKKSIDVVNSSNSLSSKISKINKFASELEYDYGVANNQVTMTGIEKFHNAGFKGTGIQIAVIDAGFYGVNTAGAFSHLFDNNQENGEILGGYDFVNSITDFYTNTGTAHGTNVLSTIAAIKEDEFVGTAPNASFYLFVTEDANSETPLEESLWVQAAERADVLGVDIINTSLGYNQFDDSKYNYTYADMDGETTFITRGSNIAAEKGMVIVNSAGNSGNDSWKYLTAPADAKNIIAVGAVDAARSITSFSSFGPSADNRIKPETLAQGGNVFVIDENNNVGISNGTSFSGPIISGVVACLWQAYSEKTSLEIRQMVIENSELYNNPRDQEGYGILNVSNLRETLSLENGLPFSYDMLSDNLKFKLNKDFDKVLIQVFSVLGQALVNVNLEENNNNTVLENLPTGIYYIRYHFLDKTQTVSFYKR